MNQRIELEGNARKLYVLAAHKWGNRGQMDMVQEEAAELIQAISKVKRAGAFFPSPQVDELAKELADVRIMVAQMEQMFGLSGKVEEWIERKLFRLELRINKESGV